MKILSSSLCTLFAALLGGQALAQTVTGTIIGTVTDPSGRVIIGASVTVTNERTGDVRTTTTNESGAFTITALQPGGYTLKVEAPGFSTLQRTGLVLSANERLSVGDLRLSIGAVTETISVVSEGAVVKTASAEHSAIISSDQMATMLARGRDVVSLLRLLPGVVYGTDPEHAGGTYGTGSPAIAGTPARMNYLTVDGLFSNDMGSPGVFSGTPSMDAISEVKVMLKNYQAEYAGNGGAVVQVVTKSGGREYHGTGYWYKRHEMFNANNFFNNRTSVPKPLYRYNTLGFSLGGPIYIPGKFNQNKDRWFGFYSLEQWGIKYPGSLQQVTVPTALERAGDFSQTLDLNDRLIPITDPLSRQPFPGNLIPASRINRNGLALLNILPLPNFTDRTVTKGNYNYQFQEVLDQPKRHQLFKVDYLPTHNDRFSVRGKTYLSEQQGYAVASGASAWGLFKQCYCFTESGITVAYTRVFSPTVVMEITGGARTNYEKWIDVGGQPEVDKVLRQKRGFLAGQWYPANNPGDFIPRVTWGGVPNSADITYDDRFLTGGADATFSFNDNVSIIRGSHLFKVGVAISRLREYEGEQSVFSGRFNFGRDVNNPFDSNWAYSNTLLGNFASYEESTSRYGANLRQTLAEWFAQDTWKATRKLSIDYGLRFTWYNFLHYPEKYAGQAALLALERYDPKKAPVLYRPAIGPDGKRAAQNPLTGEFRPMPYIGAFVPGSGNPAPGAVLCGDKTYPKGWINQQPVQLGPRLGIAYDPFGRGKTAIRAGGGIFYNFRVSRWSATAKNPPATFTPVLYYGNLDTFLQSAGVLFPSDTRSFNKDNLTPAVYNLTFGIQQDVGFATILDVSYVTTLGRRVEQSKNLNTLPYGVRFLPQSMDPTSPGKPLPDAFLRPMPGYNAITYYDNAYSSNYHALMVSLDRRFTKGLQFGLAYTYSKYMEYSSIPIYRPLRVWSYGKSDSDRTHSMVLNYLWELPKASARWPNPVTRHALDNWQISGITAFVSGSPSGVGFSTTDAADINGGGDGTRIVVTGKAQLPHGQRTLERWFDPTVFARPAVGDPGNAPRDVFRLPGFNNWDIALVKRIPLKREDRHFQLRWEMYNAFNHTQFAGVDSSARFDPQGKQVNARFGQVTSARAARVMQASLRFTF